MSARSTRNRVSKIGMVFGLLFGCMGLLLGCIGPRPAGAQPAPSDRVDVLFFGDDSFHQPAARVKQILPRMADRGINLFYTERLEVFEPETLGRYDVVMLYGNSPHLSRGREVALLNFVAGGGGLVAVHSASAMFGNSDAYVSLVGGAFESHGVDSFGTDIVRPDHPVMRGVSNVVSWDETYVHDRHNPDKEVLSVRVDGDHEEPWTWVRRHGAGGVFYTAWGHDERTWSNAAFHDLIERGIRWSAGDWALTAELAPPPLEYGMEGSAPYYPPGVGWGVTGDPITRLQLPLSPAASMQQTSLEPGFRLELFASEPDVVNPIDMKWDERGRLWIVETLDYPNDFEPGRRGTDRIKILEDTDGDGRADAFTVFADSLNIPTSLVLSNGGVIVAQAPDMLFLKDTDGDDRADVREVLFTGWGTFDTHAGPSNLRYGFDNHIWGAVGYSGFSGAVDGDSMRLTQGLHRFWPDGSRLEQVALTNNNTWGLGFSEEGHAFGSTANGNPSNFVAIPSRYYARLKGEFAPDDNARGNVPVLPPIAEHAVFFPFAEEVRQVDHHGAYTSAAGHELYTARAFPRAYWNRAAFVAGPTGHLLGRFFLEPDGSGFRAQNEANLAASRDAWFAPIQARVGPDGALWIIDWYNLIIQHNPTPPDYDTGEGNAYETALRDRRHSRIYRIVHEDATTTSGISDLGDATPEELVLALGNDNMHWRLIAQRLLVERGESDVLPQLYRLVNDLRVDDLALNPGAIHALWTMHGLGALDGRDDEALAVATGALHHPSTAVRRTALMVLPPTPETFEAIQEAGLHPADPQLRLAVLLAIADAPASVQAGESVAELLLRPANATDRWIRDAAAIAGARHGEGFLRRVLQEDLGARRTDSSYVANLRGAVGTVAAHHAAEVLADFLVELVVDLETADPALAEAYLEAIANNWPEAAPPSLSAEQRVVLKAMHENVSISTLDHLRALVTRWGMPDLIP